MCCYSFIILIFVVSSNTDGHVIARAAWCSQVLITNWYFFSSKVTSNQWFFTNMFYFFYSTLKGYFCWYMLDDASNIFTALEGKFVSIPHPFSSVRFTFILHKFLACSLTSLLLFAANFIMGYYVNFFYNCSYPVCWNNSAAVILSIVFLLATHFWKMRCYIPVAFRRI